MGAQQALLMGIDQDPVKSALKLPSNAKPQTSELWEGGDILSQRSPVLWLHQGSCRNLRKSNV